eukprot:4194103-Prymnesium_polylepis.1
MGRARVARVGACGVARGARRRAAHPEGQGRGRDQDVELLQEELDAGTTERPDDPTPKPPLSAAVTVALTPSAASLSRPSTAEPSRPAGAAPSLLVPLEPSVAPFVLAGAARQTDGRVGGHVAHPSHVRAA